MLDQSGHLRLLRAQSLYELGRLADANAALKEVRSNDNSNTRQLEINLGIVSGDWESLQRFVEIEWAAREMRSAKDLLRAGALAQRIGSPRNKDLVREAAEKAPGDPLILINCYTMATEGGWENSQDVFEWMETSAKLSGPTGPVQTMTMEDLVQRGPLWNERETNIWEMLGSGEMPMFAAAKVLNRTLLGMFAFPALANLDENDPRQRPFIYAFSGARAEIDVDGKTIAMDATALLTAEFLGVLDAYLASYSIVVPHNVLGWLLEEKAKTLFHQPSRVVVARELREMLNDDLLRPFAGSAIAPESLVVEVGDALAAMLAEASSQTGPEQRLVVRGGPIHKVGSLMNELADVSAYEECLCSNFDVVDKLLAKSQLTAAEAEAARAGLIPREIPWSAPKEIHDGAILYLDDLAVSHLQFLGLLGKLKRAGITAVVSPTEKAEADNLIAFDRMSGDVSRLVESLRAKLRDGISSERVRLTQSARVDDENSFEAMFSHPTMALVKDMGAADAAIVDDRFVNQHPRITSGESTRPLLSSLDGLRLLERKGAITAAQRQEALTKLRRANFIFIPVVFDELTRLLALTTAKDGILVESAELRAIRENVQRVRMSKILQMPKEIIWLNGVIGTCLLALKEQWVDDVDFDVARARSDWLIDLGHPTNWAHRVAETSKERAARHRQWLGTLMVMPVTQSDGVKDAYWQWFDDRILHRMEQEDPEGYAALLERGRSMVEEGILATSPEMEGCNG